MELSKLNGCGSRVNSEGRLSTSNYAAVLGCLIAT